MQSQTLPVVVIGAPAGGVEALQQLIGGLPASLEAAVLIVLHLPAHVKSDLASVLQRMTPLPVSDAQNGRVLEAGHIYVATPDRHLLVTLDGMRLTHAPKESCSRPSIDALFRSAADTFGPNVIGVLLSGMLDDGTSGLWAIKDRGGVALVQGNVPVVFASMPEGAALQVDVDAVIPVQHLGEMIAGYVARLAATQSASMDSHADTSTEADAGLSPGRQEMPELIPVAPSACPVCHSSLVAEHEPSTQLPRRHGGHGATANTLLLDIGDAIDKGLWDTLRAVEERVMLLREMALSAKEAGSASLADDYTTQANDVVAKAEPLRSMVLTTSPFGHV
jgi:two-component system chemotaxis response regulator CheB